MSNFRPEKIVLKKWYNIYKDEITLLDYEIHDGFNFELYYKWTSAAGTTVQRDLIHSLLQFTVHKTKFTPRSGTCLSGFQSHCENFN